MNDHYIKMKKRQEASKLRFGDLMVAFLTASALAITALL